MITFVQHAYSKLSRDDQLPWYERFRKGVRYVRELMTAPFHLRNATRIGRRARTLLAPRIENFGQLIIGDDVIIRSINVPVELCTGHAGSLVIGEGTFINYGASIAAMGMVSIGKRALIGPYVMIVDNHFHDPYDRHKQTAPEPVFIDDDVWIGAKASILPGVTIGRGAVIGTGAVVTRDVAPFTVVAGVPAKEVKRLSAESFVARP